MEFGNELKAFADKILEIKDSVKNEEATKMSMIVLFLRY